MTRRAAEGRVRRGLLARGVEADVLPACQRHGMGVLTWSPLAFGFLSGKYRKGLSVDLTQGRAPRLHHTPCHSPDAESCHFSDPISLGL